MTDKELHKLSRRDLLVLLVEQAEETEKLREQNAEYKKKQADFELLEGRLKLKLNEKDLERDHFIQKLDEKDALIEKFKQKLNLKDAQIKKLSEYILTGQMDSKSAQLLADSALTDSGVFNATFEAVTENTEGTEEN